MTKYKIVANENIKLNRGNEERLFRGDELTIDSPSSLQLEELERFERTGMITLTELEKETIRTVEEGSDEPEEDETSSDEFDVEFEEYECPECDRTHYVDSQIGKEHLEMYLEENN